MHKLRRPVATEKRHSIAPAQRNTDGGLKKQITRRKRPPSSSSSLLYIFNGSEGRNDVDARKDRSEQPSLRHKTWSTLEGGKAKKGETQRGHQWQGRYISFIRKLPICPRPHVRMLAINVRYELFSKVEITTPRQQKKKEKKRDKRGYFEPQESRKGHAADGREEGRKKHDTKRTRDARHSGGFSRRKQ